MDSMIILKRLLVIFLITSFAANTIGCTKRVLVPMDRNFLEKESLLHVRLTSGKIVKVKKPQIEDGYLFGMTPVYKTRPGPHKEIRINIDDIESIRVERFDRRKTIISLTATAVSLSMFFFIASRVNAIGKLQ